MGGDGRVISLDCGDHFTVFVYIKPSCPYVHTIFLCLGYLQGAGKEVTVNTPVQLQLYAAPRGS